MAVWPVTVPQDPYVIGYTEQPPNLVIRSEVDAGPAKVRRRFSAGARVYNLRFRVDGTDAESIDAFYLAQCASEWEFPENPRKQDTTAIAVRFLAPPVITPLGGDNWEIDIVIEEMPWAP